MPDSLTITGKKYAIVTFLAESNVEVVPSIWLISRTEIMWPNTTSIALLGKLIKECTPLSSNRLVYKIKINGFTNSFGTANRKATEALETSHLSSDSSESASLNKSRKRKKPVRYQSSESSGSGSESESIISGKRFPVPSLPKNDKPSCSTSKHISIQNGSGSESESIISGKRFPVPSLPKNDKPSCSTSKHISNYQVLTAKENIFQKNDFPPNASYSGVLTSKENISQKKNDLSSNALYTRLFEYMEKMNMKIGELTTEIHQLRSQFTNSTNINPDLPDDVILPVTSVDELEKLNNKLKNDKGLSATLAKFLFNQGYGKSQRSFILSVTKRILAQDVAVQFSRFGRKGKKSFQNYRETINVILAATSLKFNESERESSEENFGKCLASAPDWNRKNIRITVVNEGSELLFTDELEQ